MPERIRGLAEHFGECQAELFAGVETGAEDDFLDRDVGFEEQAARAFDAAVLDFLQKAAAGGLPEATLESAAADSQAMGKFGNIDLVVRVIQDVIDGEFGDFVVDVEGFQGLAVGIGEEMGDEADGLPGELAGVGGGRAVGGEQKAFELGTVKRWVLDDGLDTIEPVSTFLQPGMGKMTIEGNPAQRPAGIGQRVVAVPLTGNQEKGIARGKHSFLVGGGCHFAGPLGHQAEGELGQTAANVVLECIELGLRQRIGLAGRNPLPTGVGEVERLVEKPVRDRQGVAEWCGAEIWHVDEGEVG